MAGTLTVWTFPTELGAHDAVETLKELQKQELITIRDGAEVSWPEGAKKPKTHQLNDVKGPGALGGAFWGLFLGLLFFVPRLGAALGAGLGALAGALTDVGIDDGFINRVREEVTPGTSALFILTADATVDRVHEAFAGQSGELISTNLSHAEEAQLREVFAD